MVVQGQGSDKVHTAHVGLLQKKSSRFIPRIQPPPQYKGSWNIWHLNPKLHGVEFSGKKNPGCYRQLLNSWILSPQWVQWKMIPALACDTNVHGQISSKTKLFNLQKDRGCNSWDKLPASTGERSSTESINDGSFWTSKPRPHFLRHIVYLVGGVSPPIWKICDRQIGSSPQVSR